ncbi:hypothetical protein F4818DRAFT_256536 [Hypoxylon cercidicola]|nr:hypothetical protein F4818DRAFT_256536 [Hypoxylon cercidicola]
MPRYSERANVYNVSPSAFLDSHPQYDCLAVSALVMFGVTPNTRALIVRRGSGASLPGKWEIPTGPCNPDLTILDSLTSILLEETRVRVEFIADLAGMETFDIQSGKRVCKLTFVVQSKNDIPMTLQKYDAWDLISLDEASQARSINFGLLDLISAPHREVILQGFEKYDQCLELRHWCHGGTMTYT